MPNRIQLHEFGKDHWSLLAYIECRCVDHEGWLDNRHLRLDGEKYPTKLRGGIKKNHSDVDCLKDLQEAGLIYGGRASREVDRGKKIELTYQYSMTERGEDLCAKIRAHKGRGGNFAEFKVDEQSYATA